VAGRCGGRAHGGDGPSGVGTRYTTTRRIAGIVRTGTTSKITEPRPPRSWAARGACEPVRETIKYTVEPLGENAGSRVTIELDFEGRGIGRLLVPLVVRRLFVGEAYKLPSGTRSFEAEYAPPHLIRLSKWSGGGSRGYLATLSSSTASSGSSGLATTALS
jgi:hypothetical protein